MCLQLRSLKVLCPSTLALPATALVMCAAHLGTRHLVPTCEYDGYGGNMLVGILQKHTMQ